MTGDIRLIAVDIDGTLLDSTGTIPPAHRDALTEAHARGIQIALATGRALHFARPVVDRLGLPVALIVNNGALARTPDGHTTLRRVVDREVARAVLEAGGGFEDSVALLFDRDDDRQLVFEHMDWSHPNRAGYYARNRAFMSQGSLDAALRLPGEGRPARDVHGGHTLVATVPSDEAPGCDPDDAPIQVMFNGSVAAMRRLAADLRGLAIAERFTVAITEYEARDFALVDVNGPGCSKGSTLESYADRCGIAREHVMAVGDNLNDLEMLEFAGWPVVMGNASDDIKRRGFPVVPSHDDGGLAVAIERFVLGRPAAG